LKENKFLWVSTWSAPNHEVSVHPTLYAVTLEMKCRFLLSELGHIVGSQSCQFLPFVVIQIKFGYAFIYWYVSCANT
jgi:hypothetical protein